MAAIKLQKFLGAAPKVSAELLPDGAGQTANNVQLYSGDLIPYPEAFASSSIPRLGTIQTIFGIRNPAAPTTLEWLSWLVDVDVVTISDSNDDELRFYYTGDDVPKVTTFALATAGAEPYPAAGGFYDLGLPLPTVEPVATSQVFTSPTSASYERDSGNTAIITTAAAHGFRSGQVVTVRDFTTGIATEWNVVNTRITVTSPTTFEYFNAGDAVATVANAEATIDLAGGTVTRDYTYTWYTPWDEESIGADPSDTLFIKEGQSVTVTSLPTAAPAGDNFITAMRLYRTLTSSAGTDFFRLTTLYFPQTTALVSVTSNVASVTMSTHHSFIVGDRFKLAGCTDSTFDIIDGIVTVVDSDTKFSYALATGNIVEKADTTGQLYHDASEIPDDDDAVYWGDANNKTTHRARDTKVVTLTTDTVHNLLVGHRVTVANMTDSTYDDTEVLITAVPSTTTFSYVGTGGIATANTARTSNVATIETGSAHGYATSDVITVTGVTQLDTDFNEEDVTVTVVDGTHFTYPNVGSNRAETADTGGLCRVDETTVSDTAGTILNDSFLDNFDFLNLVDLLLTDDYAAPDPTMTGLTLAQNNLLVGFYGNQLAFAEPTKPHAWPEKYLRTFEYDIVALVAVAGFLLVLTEEFAYRVSGSDPATLAIARIDNPYPCLSKRSVVNMGYGALFATYGGIALWNPTAGMTFVTEFVHDFDTFDSTLDPSTIVAHFFNDKYFASFDTGAFIFQHDKKIGGFYVTTGHRFNSAWTDPTTNIMHTSSDALGNITEWGNDANILAPYEWKSKVVVSKNYINIGAARVIADFTVTAEDSAAYTAYNVGIVAFNAAVWADSEQLGSINGPTDYSDGSGVEINNFASFNTSIVNGPGSPLGLIRASRTVPSAYTLIFNLWQNKTLVFTKAITDDAIFRCPVGYKSDTFEISIAGVGRTRAIHLGETPDGLREA
tara:strand:+ start:128 stop:2977 length:2850 start_codon:yes stop_codon:yes gene_type:complete